MFKQTFEVLSVNEKNNCESQSETLLGLDQEKIVKTSNVKNSGEDRLAKIMENGFELFMRLSYCQTMLYKTWVDASDKVASKVQDLAETSNDPEDTSLLHIEVCDDAFTNLFKSTEYASNLGSILNLSTNYMVAWKQYLRTVCNTADAYSESNNQEQKEKEVH